MVFHPVEEFVDASSFAQESSRRIKEFVGEKKVYVPVSGGIDSSSAGAIVYNAVGDNMVAEHYDHGGMREGEPEAVVNELGKIFPVTRYDARKIFMDAVMKAGEDSEAKRKAVSGQYAETLIERARHFGCCYVADGTIALDVHETQLGLKSQHNALSAEQRRSIELAGLSLIYPLYHQAKPQSRAVATYYGLPSGRMAFPGPGLYIRAIGQVTPEKMAVARKADSIATPMLQELLTSRTNGLDRQYFVAIMDSWRRPVVIDRNIPGISIMEPCLHRAKGTGMIGKKRSYEHILTFDSVNDISELIPHANRIVTSNLDRCVGRVAVTVRSGREGEFSALIRAVETADYNTATAVPLKKSELEPIAVLLMREIPKLNEIHYDIQNKGGSISECSSTIEFE